MPTRNASERPAVAHAEISKYRKRGAMFSAPDLLADFHLPRTDCLQQFSAIRFSRWLAVARKYRRRRVQGLPARQLRRQKENQRDKECSPHSASILPCSATTPPETSSSPAETIPAGRGAPNVRLGPLSRFCGRAAPASPERRLGPRRSSRGPRTAAPGR